MSDKKNTNETNDNPLIIPVKGSTLEKAMINLINKMSNDMYDEKGKIKFIQNDTEKNKEDAADLKEASAADNEAILDLDFRLSQLEEQ